MLVLTRRVGEEIVIDGHIRITITAVNRDRVRLGIEAPDNIRVDRREVHDRIVQFDDSGCSHRLLSQFEESSSTPKSRIKCA
jgi:carbon storage regulator